jgi:hypothetical protein
MVNIINMEIMQGDFQTASVGSDLRLPREGARVEIAKMRGGHLSLHFGAYKYHNKLCVLSRLDSGAAIRLGSTLALLEQCWSLW